MSLTTRIITDGANLRELSQTAQTYANSREPLTQFIRSAVRECQ